MRLRWSVVVGLYRISDHRSPILIKISSCRIGIIAVCIYHTNYIYILMTCKQYDMYDKISTKCLAIVVEILEK